MSFAPFSRKFPVGSEVFYPKESWRAELSLIGRPNLAFFDEFVKS